LFLTNVCIRLIYASANVVAGGIVFPECSCVFCERGSQTNMVSKISWVFVDGIWPNFQH